MNILYRRVNLTDPEEMQAIAEIDMTIPALYDSMFEVNEATIADRLKQLMKCHENDFFDVAFADDGKIVGYHFMNQFKSPPNGVMAADIQTLWVDPEYRRQGIARTLKERGEAWARDQKLSHISTFVNAKNLPMQALNQDLGFELVGYKLRKKIIASK